MYTSDKPRPVDFYMGEVRGMMIEIVDNNNTPNTTLQSPQHQQRMILGESSGGEEHENIKAPKKRAETWVQEEIRSLINFRREVDCVFNTSKSNKHLWDQISCRMREKGFDRSASMCTDKWRNLLKEFKKARHKERGGAFAKLSYYKELEELLRERSKKSPKVGSYVQFADKGLEDANIPFGSIEGSGRPTLNHERRVDHNRHPLAITATDSVATHGLPPWNWRSTSGNGGENQPYDGRVITVKWREYTKRIGIDGSADAIKEAIKSAFGLRTQRAFWLEDEDEVIRTLDRDMPLGNYTLHLDEGVSIKICIFDESENLQIQTEEKTLYTEDDYRDFLGRRGWSGLREMNDFRCVDTLNDIRTGAMYHGVRMVRD